MDKSTPPQAVGSMEAVRPVIDAYKHFAGVIDDRFDGLTDIEMSGGAAYSGYQDFRAGWDAALTAVCAEIERLTYAPDYGDNKYRRQAEVDRLAPFLKRLGA